MSHIHNLIDFTIEVFIVHKIRWLTASDLNDPQYSLQEDVKFYAKEALKKAF